VTWGIGASARRELAVATLSALVMLCGFALTVRGVGELVRTKRDLAAYQAALATRGGPVVTDLFWLPAALAPYYVSHEVYVTQGRDDLATWVHKIGGQRPDFVYVTAEPELPANALPLLIEREQTFVNGMWFFDVTVRALH